MKTCEEDDPREPKDPSDDSPWEEQEAKEDAVMTIAIGFVCKGCIILASDSQISNGDTKSFDEDKVFRLKFLDAVEGAAIAVSSENLSASTRFLEKLEEKTTFAEIKLEAQIPALVREAIMDTRAEMLDFVDDGTTSAEQRDRHLASRHYRVILAYYYASKPHIYTFSSMDGIPRQVKRDFVAIGSGASIARLILSGGFFSDFQLPSALGLAAYTIEACKKFDRYCGGDFQHLLLSQEHKGGAVRLEKDVVDAYSEAARKIDFKLRKFIAREIVDEASKILEGKNDAWVAAAQRAENMDKARMVMEGKDPNEKKARKRNR